MCAKQDQQRLQFDAGAQQFSELELAFQRKIHDGAVVTWFVTCLGF